MVMLVDSLINTVVTMIEFTRRGHHLGPIVRAIMVAGVMQAQAIGKLQKPHEICSIGVSTFSLSAS